MRVKNRRECRCGSGERRTVDPKVKVTKDNEAAGERRNYSFKKRGEFREEKRSRSGMIMPVDD